MPAVSTRISQHACCSVFGACLVFGMLTMEGPLSFQCAKRLAGWVAGVLRHGVLIYFWVSFAFFFSAMYQLGSGSKKASSAAVAGPTAVSPFEHLTALHACDVKVRREC